MKAFLSVVALSFVACGGSVAGVPSSGDTNANATQPAGGASATTPASPSEECKIACDEGHTRVANDGSCNRGSACYTRTACATTITCTGPAGLCEEPECLGYFQEVKSCPPNTTCETQQFCDKTLLCAKSDAQCDGLASCDEGDEQVASATECATYGFSCYARSSCGARTYCVRKGG